MFADMVYNHPMATTSSSTPATATAPTSMSPEDMHTVASFWLSERTKDLRPLRISQEDFFMTLSARLRDRGDIAYNADSMRTLEGDCKAVTAIAYSLATSLPADHPVRKVFSYTGGLSRKDRSLDALINAISAFSGVGAVGEVAEQANLSIPKVVALAKRYSDFIGYRKGYHKVNQGCLKSQMEAGYYPAQIFFRKMDSAVADKEQK